MKDLTYVTLAAGGSYVIVTPTSFPAKTVSDLVTLAKAKPGQISYGSSGVGGPVHLAGELFNSRAGVKILHVPYKGAGPILAAVLSNEVQLGYPSVAGALPLIKAGRVYAARGHERAACESATRRADDRGVGLPGLRHHALVRFRRACRHAPARSSRR